MHEAVREMTFEEEYEILQRESERVFANEKECYEPPLANCVLRRALRCIRKLQEQPKADWIPSEERLPEPIRPVLVTVKNWMNDKPFVRMGRFHTNHWEVQECVVENSKIIAWQPLPQPYKKEGAE